MLELLFNHFDSKFKGDYELETKYQIENTLDRDLKEEKAILLVGKDGIERKVRVIEDIQNNAVLVF